MGLKELANKIFPAAIADDENYAGDIYENDDFVEEETRGAVMANETYSSRGANVTVQFFLILKTQIEKLPAVLSTFCQVQHMLSAVVCRRLPIIHMLLLPVTLQ